MPVTVTLPQVCSVANLHSHWTRRCNRAPGRSSVTEYSIHLSRNRPTPVLAAFGYNHVRTNSKAHLTASIRRARVRVTISTLNWAYRRRGYNFCGRNGHTNRLTRKIENAAQTTVIAE